MGGIATVGNDIAATALKASSSSKPFPSVVGSGGTSPSPGVPLILLFRFNISRMLSPVLPLEAVDVLESFLALVPTKLLLFLTLCALLMRSSTSSSSKSLCAYARPTSDPSDEPERSLVCVRGEGEISFDWGGKYVSLVGSGAVIRAGEPASNDAGSPGLPGIREPGGLVSATRPSGVSGVVGDLGVDGDKGDIGDRGDRFEPLGGVRPAAGR